MFDRQVANLTTELATAAAEQLMAEKAAVVLQQALTQLEVNYKTLQASEQQRQAEMTQLRAQLQTAQASRPPAPQPFAQPAPPPPPQQYGQNPVQPAYPYAAVPQYQHPQAAAAVPYMPPQTQPQPQYHHQPQSQYPPHNHYQQQQQHHPAIAELQVLQGKYDGLKTDYNLLIGKYEAQKQQIREGGEALTVSQTALTECEAALERAQRLVNVEHELCERTKLECARLQKTVRSLGDSLDRARDKASVDKQRSAQMQRTISDQLDALLEEKNQLAAQLQVWTSSKGSSGNEAQQSAAAEAQASDELKAALIGQQVAQQQKDSFSDDLMLADDTVKEEEAADEKAVPELASELAASPLKLAAIADPTQTATPSVAAKDEPEEGEVVN